MPHAPSTAAISRHPIHATLASFPIVCFWLTLFADIAYWQTAHLLWQHFAEWLLFAGLVFGALAALAGAVDFAFRREVRRPGAAWPHAIGSVVVLLLAFVNSLVHARDGWTGVVPEGLILSAVTVIVMMISDWLGRSMVYRHGVGVSASDYERSERT
jgi:uncharacterized membrane protein